MIGDEESCKSELMSKYFNKPLEDMNKTDNGLYVDQVTLEWSKKTVNYSILDTTGHNPEFFKSLILGIDCILAVFNRDKRSSYENLQQLLKPIQEGEYGDISNIEIVIVEHT